MKKISILLVILMSTLVLSSPVMAVAEQNTIVSGEVSQKEAEESKKETVGNAANTTIEKNLMTKEEKIAEYAEKVGSKSNGTIMFYLYEVARYSVPVCFIGLTIAALNFFIIGNKKLEKREQGFSMLMLFAGGLIFFQVLPLLFAIVVAGR